MLQSMELGRTKSDSAPGHRALHDEGLPVQRSLHLDPRHLGGIVDHVRVGQAASSATLQATIQC